MIYNFDNFELDIDRFELHVDGVEHHLEPLVFDFLHYLVKNPNRIISRDEIIEEIWLGRIVSDTTISSCVKSLRKALGDDGEHQKYIKTIRGRGFQFLATVETQTVEGIKTTEESTNSPPATGTRKSQFLKLGIIGSLLLIIVILFSNQQSDNITKPSETNSASGSYSIAVMPFIDLSADNSQEYFGDGISEEVLNILTTVDELDVTSRTTAFTLKGENLSVPEIAERLNVNYIVEGTVRNSGNRIRITAELIDTNSDNRLWSESYDRELGDIFAIQDDISLQITNALRVELIGDVIGREAPTNNMEAYSLYLQGHQVLLNRNASNIETAISFLENAVALDAAFAESWADLATSYLLLLEFTIDNSPQEIIRKATNSYELAIKLDPELAEAWSAKGFAHYQRLEWLDAREALERASELDPNNDMVWLRLGLNYIYTGYFELAKEAMSNALEIAPTVPVNGAIFGRSMFMQGQFDEARPLMENSKSMGWWAASNELAVMAMLIGNQQTAFEEFENYIGHFDQHEDDRLNEYVKAYFDPSLRENARILLETDLDEGNMQAKYGSFLLQDGEAYVYYLENIAIAKTSAISHLYWPTARPMLNQQPVKDYIEKIGLIDYWREEGWPYFCKPLGNNDFECN